MEQSGKNKFYLRLSFYTIICTIVYAILVIYLYSNHLLLRTRVNIVISFLIIILVGFSVFQNIITKTKGNAKLIAVLIIFLLIFGTTVLSNKYVIDNYLSREDIKEYKGEKYITVQKNNETYYFVIYSDLIRASVPKYSVSEKVFEDGDVRYITSTIVEFDKNGSVKSTNSDTRTESGE